MRARVKRRQEHVKQGKDRLADAPLKGPFAMMAA